MNGFKGCGIWPVNRYMFNDSDFAVNPLVLSPDALMDKSSNMYTFTLTSGQVPPNASIDHDKLAEPSSSRSFGSTSKQ